MPDLKAPIKAVIRENECIGCTKCLQACPADAILGSSTLMHTVIEDECIGCRLCVAPCPVDCIDMVAVGVEDKVARRVKAERFKERYRVREGRLAKEMVVVEVASNPLVDEKKAYILAALERAKLKKKL